MFRNNIIQQQPLKQRNSASPHDIPRQPFHTWDATPYFPRHSMLFDATLCRAIPRHSMPFYSTSIHATLRYDKQPHFKAIYHSTPRHITPRHSAVLSLHATPCHPFRVTPQHAMQWHVIQCQATRLCACLQAIPQH